MRLLNDPLKLLVTKSWEHTGGLTFFHSKKMEFFIRAETERTKTLQNRLEWGKEGQGQQVLHHRGEIS